MEPDNSFAALPLPAPQPAPRGLPPVTPPSGRFIAQLFLVPGAIVLMAVLLLMMFHNLFSGNQTAAQFLRQLDSNNREIRWRAASDLAQTLERSDSVALRTDPEFAAELVERLRLAEAELKVLWSQQPQARKQTADKEGRFRSNRHSSLSAPSDLELAEEYVCFLALAVARLHTPLAIAVLCDMARSNDSPDDIGPIMLRRQALFALATLGDNVQIFSKLPEEQRTGIVEYLQRLAEANDGRKTTWARTALYYVDKPRLEKIRHDPKEIMHVDAVLALCADVDDPFARETVALALRFWEGELVEKTLIKLSRDDGHGKKPRLEK